MEGKGKLAAPCGLYCGVCAIYIAHKRNSTRMKEGTLTVLQRLPNVDGVGVEDIHCEGCLSDDLFKYCQVCAIRSCAQDRQIEGCHRCSDFPCKHIDDFPISVGKKVILRSVPAWRELGTEKWMEEEEKRYRCPHCGEKLFRGVRKCRGCGQAVDVD